MRKLLLNCKYFPFIPLYKYGYRDTTTIMRTTSGEEWGNHKRISQILALHKWRIWIWSGTNESVRRISRLSRANSTQHTPLVGWMESSSTLFPYWITTDPTARFLIWRPNCRFAPIPPTKSHCIKFPCCTSACLLPYIKQNGKLQFFLISIYAKQEEQSLPPSMTYFSPDEHDPQQPT